jgi:hypothetical protein
MGKSTARAKTDEPVALVEVGEAGVLRLCPSRHASAVEVRRLERRYLVLTDRRGLVHAQQILESGALGEPLADDEFDALHEAFQWGC